MEQLQSSFPQLTAVSALSAEDVLRLVWFFQQQFSLNTDPKASFSSFEDSRSVRP